MQQTTFASLKNIAMNIEYKYYGFTIPKRKMRNGGRVRRYSCKTLTDFRPEPEHRERFHKIMLLVRIDTMWSNSNLLN